nr:peptide II [Aplysia californica]
EAEEPSAFMTRL